MKKLFFSLILITILSSCHFNAQYLNRIEDKKDAELITNEFYNFIKTKDFEKTYDLFSNEFFNKTPKDKLFKMLSVTNEKLGNLVQTEIKNWETRRVEGSNPLATYSLIYKNKYEKFEAEETIHLLKEKDGKIRIVGYFINSDGFMN